MNKLLLFIALLVLPASATFAQSLGGTELTDQRDMYSKTYLLPDGQKQALIHGGPAHYFNGTSWEEIDPTLSASATSISNTTNVIASKFPKQPSANSIIQYTINGQLIELSLKKELVRFESGVTILETFDTWMDADYSTTQITYTDVNSGVEDVYKINNGEVKNDLLLHYAPGAQPSEGVYYGFREKLTLPSGWKLQAATLENDPKTNHGIFVLDASNTPQLLIPAPIVHDANGLENNGSIANDAAFVVEEENGSWYISTLVSSDWINAPERAFPITFDPTITIAGNTGGWQSQNNYVDNPGFVFIGVCCGNLEHRAWLKWSVASIPTNACVSSVEMELYVNGVGSSVAELVHAFDMMTTTSTNLWGPYGAIMTNVYNDQATGWYCSFTMTGTGTYGWYDLGANAAADVMTMVNSYGWYQVGIIFDNEPSTNWKRMSATLCDLRVTYEDPPCTVLPIELADFDVSCHDGQAAINWTTSSEFNNDYFTISKSVNGEQFIEVTRISGAGNSNQTLQYTYYDDTRHDAPVYYRLSQTDFDGASETYLPKLFSGCDQNEVYVSTEQGSKIRVRGESIQSVAVLDAMGRSISTYENRSKATSILLPTNVNGGLYLVRVMDFHGNITTEHIYLD
ncbi:MAG: hypothetical protein NXI10_02210 [bacterium]|nr:hypothetical protein [bacterium]